MSRFLRTTAALRPSRFLIPLLLTALWACLALPAGAADLLVRPDGSTAYPTIQDAIDAAGNGDVILLAAGTYTGPGNRNLESDSGPTIRAQFPGDEVVIDLQGSSLDPARGMLITDGVVTLEGLTFIGGFNFDGGTIDLEAGAFTAIGCRFLYNRADQGGAVNCTAGDRVEMTDCIMARNRAGTGGAIYADYYSDVVLTNCTLFMNHSDDGSAVYRRQEATLAMESCIVAFGKGTHTFSDYYGGTLTAANTNIWGNEGGDWVDVMAPLLGTAGNLWVEPEMCDPAAGNFALSANSPCWVPPLVVMGGGGIDLTWTVPVYELRPDGDGMYATIQAALDAVPDPAKIALQWGGAYEGDGNVELDFLGKRIELGSREGQLATIDAHLAPNVGRRAVWLRNGEPAGTRIHDLVIDYGFADYAGAAHDGIGGAILVSGDASLTLENVSFTGGSASIGGSAVGITASDGELVVDSCYFSGPVVQGTMIYAASGTLAVRNLAIGASDCGGVFLDTGVGQATLSNVDFVQRGVHVIEVGDAPILFDGCDLRMSTDWDRSEIIGSGNVTFRDCYLRDDGLTDGQIMTVDRSTVTFDNCDFVGRAGLGSDIAAVAAISSHIDAVGSSFSDLRRDGSRGALELTGASTASLEGCSFLRTAAGVLADDAAGLDLTLAACGFDSVGTAIRVAGAPLDHIAVTATEFVGCGAGLELSDSPDVTVTGCGFRGTGPGIPLRATDSAVTVAGSEFHDADVADAPGNLAGGILSAGGTLVVDDTEFLRNVCADGPGGIHADGAGLAVSGCLLADNVNGSYDDGGAIYCRTTAPATITGTRLERNTAYDGGAVHVQGCEVTFNGCEILDNTATNRGGGLLINPGLDHGVDVIGCLIAGNSSQQGGGIHVQEATDVRLNGSTVVGNGGDPGTEQIGVYVNADLDVRFSIIAYGPDGPAVHVGFPPQVTLNFACTDIYGNAGGDWTGMAAPFAAVSGNLTAKPWFCDADAGDYNLAADSPCLAAENTCGVTMGAFGTGCAAVSDAADLPLITRVALLQNRPNPFNPSTRIAFELPREEIVTLRIYDVAGRLVRVLLDGQPLPAGAHALSWNGRDGAGRDQATGTYLYRLQAGGDGLVRKMMLVR